MACTRTHVQFGDGRVPVIGGAGGDKAAPSPAATLPTVKQAEPESSRAAAAPPPLFVCERPRRGNV